jgi:hypothetical protein
MKLAKSSGEIALSEIFKRPAGLVDVDHTLVHSQLVLNQRLLQALKIKKIKDIYLFTDMIISQSFIEDRLKLIKALTEQGFHVHGIITPLDYFWETDQMLLESFDRACLNEKIILKNTAPKNKDKLPAVMERFPAINERVKSEVYPKFGQAFSEAVKTQSIIDETKRQEIVNQLRDRSIWCKNAIDAVSELKELKSCKGISFGQFLHQLPPWVSEIYVIDDQLDNFLSVNAVKKASKITVPLFNYHGDFTDKTETFANQLVPDLFPESTTNEADEALASKMRGIATIALNDFRQNAESVKFGATRAQQELQLAESLCSKIMAPKVSFNDQWDLFLCHLQGSYRSGFKFTDFDKKMLVLISEDSGICAAVDYQGSDNLNSTVSGQSKALDPKSFAHELLGGRLKNKDSPRRFSLSFSTGSIPKLKLTRSADASFQEAPKTPGPNFK